MLGVVTSAAYSPLRNAVVGLAMVRTTHMAAGTRVSVGPGDGAALAEATVTDLPITGE